MAKALGLPLLVLLVISAVGLPLAYFGYNYWVENEEEPFYFGVSYGQDTAEEAKILIDKVKDYTNLFLINSWPIGKNETALNEVCDYAAKSDLHFIVYFFYISSQIYSWHQTWLDQAKEKYGDKFLGIHFYDEPGGKQVDQGSWRDPEDHAENVFLNVTSNSEAANAYINDIASSASMKALKNRDIPVFTSDYALYWFDYQAGYDTVLVELGWNNSRTEQVGLCRGAARNLGKEWGAIVVWTYYEPPYLTTGPEILQDMITAYDAGAKYIVLFNYPKYPDDNQYGILLDEHFSAMEQFWSYAKAQNGQENGKGEVAIILPQYYGWGARRVDEPIWGLKTFDSGFSQQIMQNMNKLSITYGLELDIVYDEPALNITERYEKVYLWNETIT
jgi:hypothetical protein